MRKDFGYFIVASLQLDGYASPCGAFVGKTMNSVLNDNFK